MAQKRFQRLKGLRSGPALFVVLAVALVIAVSVVGYLLGGGTGGQGQKSQNNVAQEEAPKSSANIPNNEPAGRAPSPLR